VFYRPQLEPQVPNTEPPVAKVIRIEPQTLKLSVYSQGVVMPRNEIDLVPEVAGQIIRLHPSLVAGGFFAAGDILISIDPRDYNYAIAEALARIAEAERQVITEEALAEQASSEWNALGEGDATPLILRKPQLAEAQAKLKAAQAELVKRRIQLSRCEWRAPFAGRVRDKNIGLGQYVQPGEKLARLYPIDVVQVRLPLATDQFANLDLLLDHRNGKPRPGPKVTLSAEFAGASHHWEGHILRAEGAVDEQTGLLHAVAEVRDPYAEKDGQPPLLPGLFVKAEIEGRTQSGLFILPPTAVNAAQEVLCVDSEDRLRIRSVEILRREKNRVLVKSGLNAGDRIVISSIDVPIEGMRIKPEMVTSEQLPKTAAVQDNFNEVP
jgi:RND family efflux transporter MFP subunit